MLKKAFDNVRIEKWKVKVVLAWQLLASPLLISNLFSHYIKTFWPTSILFSSSLLTALFSHYNAKNARMTCNHETKRATWSGFLSHLKYPTGADMICRYSQRGKDFWFQNRIAGDFCFNLFVSGFDRLFFRIGHFCCHCCQRNSAPPFPICHLEWASISTNWFFALSLLKPYCVLFLFYIYCGLRYQFIKLIYPLNVV